MTETGFKTMSDYWNSLWNIMKDFDQEDRCNFAYQYNEGLNDDIIENLKKGD